MLPAMGPAESLRRALEESDRRLAAARVEEALVRRTPVVSFAAAHVLYCLGDHDGALKELRRVDDPRLVVRSLTTELEWMLRLGRVREARAVATRANHPRVYAIFAETLANYGCDRRALDAIDRALAMTPDSATALVFRARLLSRLGDRRGALSALARANELRDDERVARESSRLACECGDFATALRYAERGRDEEMSARIALFKGEPVESSSPTLRAIGALLSRDFQGALELSAGSDSAEALVVHAEALLGLGRPQEALAAADRAVTLAREAFIPALVMQRLSRIALGTYRGGWSAFGELAPVLRAACPDVSIDTIVDDVDATKEALERVLSTLGGNRTTIPTAVVGERLTRMDVDPGARFASRHALQRLVGDNDEEVLAALGEAIERYPRSRLPRAHRGEARMWLGDYRGAREDLEQVLREDPRTRWAYIGLTAIEMLEGDHRAALATSARGIEVMGSEGPAVFVHRGEAHRRLAQWDRANADLARARELHPRRVSATLNLALLRLSQGEAVAPLIAELRVTAPGLIVDAERECGTTIDSAPDVVLDKALAMMRGNRSSSCVTYHAKGYLRTVVLGARSDDGERDRDRAAEWIRRLGA